MFVAFVLLDGQDKLHYFSGALFQAKLYAKLDSLSQKYLYDYDTDFEVPKYLANRLTSAQNTRKMPTYDEGRGRGFRYLILNPAEDKTAIRARHCPWNHNYQLRWSTFLDGVLAGTDGLRAFLDSSSPSAWDIITSDLLYTGLNIPSRKPPRGNNIAIQVATSLFNNFTNLSDSSAIADKEIFGIPTLMIIAQAPDYKSQND